MQKHKHQKGKLTPVLRALKMEESNKEAENMRTTERILAETTRKQESDLEGKGIVAMQKAKREKPINTRALLMKF